jgi:hypothetical protein
LSFISVRGRERGIRPFRRTGFRDRRSRSTVSEEDRRRRGGFFLPPAPSPQPPAPSPQPPAPSPQPPALMSITLLVFPRWTKPGFFATMIAIALHCASTYATVVCSLSIRIRTNRTSVVPRSTRRLFWNPGALPAHLFKYATVVWRWREGLQPAVSLKRPSDTRRLPWIFVAEGDAFISRPSSSEGAIISRQLD